MNIEEFRDYCMAKSAVTEGFPFDEKTLVFKVAGKMFALADIDGFDRFNVKCDPNQAVILREQYGGVLPGYHMNKKHWNTVVIDGGIPGHELHAMIDHSYELVVASLTRKQRENAGL